MAVAATVEKIPKSEPDVTKLNTFTGRMVTVVKYLQPRGSVGKTVLPTQSMPLTQILALVTSLPLHNGPGYYKFTVADEGGTGEDVWMTRLGDGEVPQQQDGGFQMAGSQEMPGGAAPSAGVRHLGRGFYYDAELRVITTPWGTAVNWAPGETLPEPPANAASRLAAVPQNATPWNWPGQQQGQGWGIPINDSSSDRVKVLEAQLADQKQQREMDSLRADMRRAQDETNKTIAALVDKLTTTLTAKPAGPSEEFLAIQRRLELSEQTNRENERRREDDRREEQRRADMAALNTKFETTLRELSANKTDPMMTMLMQLMTSQQAAATEAVKAIQLSTTTGVQASERSTQQMMTQLAGSVMSPMQLMTLLQSAKGEAGEVSKMQTEALKGAMDLQREVFTNLLEVSGSGNQPAWLSVATTALDKIGVVGAALAERNAQQAQQPQMQQRMPAPQMQQRQMPPQQQAPAMGAMQGAGEAPISNERPPGAKFDAKTNTISLRDGRKFPQAFIQQWGWAHALALSPDQLAQEIEEMPVTVGTATAPAGASAAVTVSPSDVVPPAGKPAKSGKRGGKRGRGAEPVVAPPPADPKGYTMREMQERTPDEIRAALAHAGVTDSIMFGPLLLPHVVTLRQTTPPSDEVAGYVLTARTQIQGFGGQLPPAMELLEAGQIEVLVEWLFPVADLDYRDEVTRAIGNALEAEDDVPEGDEEEDDVEGDAPNSA